MRNARRRLSKCGVRANLRNVMNDLERHILEGIQKYLEDNDFGNFHPNLTLHQTQLDLAISIRKQIHFYLGKKS